MRLLPVLVLAVVVAGCVARDPLPSCTGDDMTLDGAWGTLCVDGVERSFRIDPDARPAPGAALLLVLHGGGGNAVSMEETTRLGAHADGEAMVVYPQGTPARAGADLRTWNAVHCCGRAWQDGTDDVAFLDALRAALVARFELDPDRVAVAGHSNGAMMAYRWAAERSGDVCCVMAVAGSIGGATPPDGETVTVPAPDHPVHALILHAHDDDRVPYDGGVGRNAGETRRDLSVLEAKAFWIDAATGPGTIQRTSGDGFDTEETVMADGTRVRVVSTTGGHGWPGDPDPGFTPAPETPDASAMVVAFLREATR